MHRKPALVKQKEWRIIITDNKISFLPMEFCIKKSLVKKGGATHVHRKYIKRAGKKYPRK